MTIDEIIKHYEQVLKELKAYKEQSGDYISRQAAISAIMSEYPDAHYPSYYKSKIDELPSATPQLRTGRWIDNHTTCSECKWLMYDDITESRLIVGFNYCPNCGARMEMKE